MHMKLPLAAIQILCRMGLLLALLAAGAGVAWAGMPETIDRIKPSIVAVGTFQKTRNPPFSFRGTGFVVGDGTLIATNAHVLPDTLQTETLESIMVITAAVEGRGQHPREAKIVAIDRQHDLALLRVSGAALPALRLGNPAEVREGQTLAFTGFPIGGVLGLFPVTHRGMVASITPIALPSATAQHLDERLIRRLQTGAFPVFQLDATAYPGNSGSPLYDIETGAVMGIINLVFVKATKESALSHPSGISFAVPVQFLQDMLRTAN